MSCSGNCNQGRSCDCATPEQIDAAQSVQTLPLTPLNFAIAVLIVLTSIAVCIACGA